MAFYELHPLLTSYLRSQGYLQKGRPDVAEKSQRVFVDAMASLADSLVSQPYDEQRIAFFLNGANFHFARHLSQHLAMGQDFAALTQFLGVYAEHSRKFVDAARLFSDLAQHGSTYARGDIEANAYHRLGSIAEAQRDLATAKAWYLKSLAISEKTGDSRGAANSFHQLGMVAEKQRDFDTAQEWYHKALTLDESQRNLEGMANTYHSLGTIAQERRDFETARKFYFKCLAILEKRESETAAMIYQSLGIIALEEQDFPAANRHYLQSLEIAETNGNLPFCASLFHELGMVAQQHQNFETAREWYLKSLTIKEKQGDVHGAALTYGQFGHLAAAQGNFEESGKWLARSISGLEQTHDEHSVALVVRNFLFFYRQAPPKEKEKLRRIWSEAGLGPFPVPDADV